LERIDVVVCEKLSKLDQKIYERFDKNEKSEQTVAEVDIQGDEVLEQTQEQIQD
jgi:hypothetical protein